VILLLSSALALANAPLELQIADSRVVAVVLECGANTEKAVVKNGVATFPAVPKASCTVNFIRKSGTITGPGLWNCTLDTCTQEDVHHAPVTDADGRLNVIITGGAEGSMSLELTCPSGYRERAAIQENTAVFNAVPKEDCMLLFKGGVPARYNHIGWGTYSCALTGTTAVCTQR
jgi:hypothetical protein